MFLSSSTVYAGSLEGLCWPLFQEGHLAQPEPVILRNASLRASQGDGDWGSTLLVAAQPRNFHLVAPTELNTKVKRAETVKQQLKFLSSSQPDAFIPQELLLELLLDNLSDGQLSSTRLLKGNRVAACQTPSPHTDQRLIVSTSGPIGDVLSLTCIYPMTPTQHAPHTHTGSPEHHVQASNSCQLSLGAEVLQVQVQAVPDAHPHHQHTPMPNLRSTTGCAGGGVWVVARCLGRVDVLWASSRPTWCHDDTAADMAGTPRWRLEWRGSLHTPVPAAHIQLHDYLPECAVLLTDGRIGLMSLAPVSCVEAAQLASPVPLSCALLMSRGQAAELLAHSREGLHTTGQRSTPHMTLVWGYQPRSLVLTVEGSMWRCDVRLAADSSLYTSPVLLHQLPSQQVFLATAAPTRAKTLLAHVHVDPQDVSRVQQCTAAHAVDLLQPYLAALTSNRVLLFDLRRPQGCVIAAPHACTVQPPTWLTFTPLLPGTPTTVDDETIGDGWAGQAGQISTQHVRQTQAGGHQGVAAPWMSGSQLWGTQASQALGGVQAQPRAGGALRAGTAEVQGSARHQGPTRLTPNLQLTWGSESGQVMCWRLCVKGSGVELVVQQVQDMAARQGDTGASRGQARGGGEEGDVPTRQVLLQPSGTWQGDTQHEEPSTRQDDSGRRAQREVVRQGRDAAGGVMSGAGQAWQPACLQSMHAVHLVRQLSPAGLLSHDPRLTALRPHRAMLHTPDMLPNTLPGAATKQMVEGRGGRLVEHIQAASQAPELQGVAVMQLWPQSDDLLLSHTTYDGDLVLQVISISSQCEQQQGVQGSAGGSEQARSSAAHVGTATRIQVAQQAGIQGLQASPGDPMHVPAVGSVYQVVPPVGESNGGAELQLPLHHTHLTSLLQHLSGSQPTQAAAAEEQGSQEGGSQEQPPQSSHLWQLSAAPLDMCVLWPPPVQSGGVTLGHTSMDVDRDRDQAGDAVRRAWSSQLTSVLKQQPITAYPATVAEVLRHAAGGVVADKQRPRGKPGSRAGRQPASNAALTCVKSVGHARGGGQGHVASVLSALLHETSLVSHVLSTTAKQATPAPSARHQTKQNTAARRGATGKAAKGGAERVIQSEAGSEDLHVYASTTGLAAGGSPSITQLISQLTAAVHDLSTPASGAAIPAPPGASQGTSSQAQDQQAGQGIAVHSCGLLTRCSPNRHDLPGWRCTPRGEPSHGPASQQAEPEQADAAGAGSSGQAGAAGVGSSGFLGPVLQTHATVLLRPHHLQPCTSRVHRWDTEAVPVPLPAAQRATQAAQGDAGWNIGLSHVAVNRYHSLLDAWPDQGGAGPDSRTGTSVGDASLFVDGYQRQAQPPAGTPAKPASTRPGSAAAAPSSTEAEATQDLAAASQATLLTTAGTRTGGVSGGVGAAGLIRSRVTLPRRPRPARTEGFN